MNVQVDFSTAGVNAQASPSIWDDCPGNTLIDGGLGYYFHDDFLKGSQNFATGVGVGDTGIILVGTAGTTDAFSTTTAGGVAAIVVSNTDNNSAALLSAPMGALVLNSGQKFWYEARFNVGTLGDGNFGIFAGFVAGASATKDTVANNPDSVAAGLISDSLIGFALMSDNVGKFYAVVEKDTAAPSTVFADVTNSAALGTATFTLTSGTFLKLGLKFDGKKTLKFYVNGVKIGSYVISAANDVSLDVLSPILCIKTGTTTARTLNVDWIRAGYQARR
jgi:hypothetical protein